MTYSQDSYHDDPVALKTSANKKKISPLLALVLLLVSGGFFLQTTLASNISLSSGTPVEFGQGILQSTACSGESQLTLTPNSAFTNVAGAGAYKFSSLTVSGIPDGCWGSEFIINAYGASDNAPLALFNSTSTSAVVYDNAGTFQVGAGASGMSLTSASNAFTITFTFPVALTSSVSRVTIQSGAHTPFYEIGSAGPGGGVIYYVSDAGFSCGPTFTTTGSPTGGLCHYLEAASTTTWTDASYDWLGDANTSVNTSDEIGAGYKNTLVMIAQSSRAGSSGTSSRAYTGGGKSDWHLPSKNDLNQMCKWQRGVTGVALTTLTTVCTGGTLNTGSGAVFVAAQYWSSSEGDAVQSWNQDFSSGGQYNHGKTTSYLVRPIRAF